MDYLTTVILFVIAILSTRNPWDEVNQRRTLAGRSVCVLLFALFLANMYTTYDEVTVKDAATARAKAEDVLSRRQLLRSVEQTETHLIKMSSAVVAEHPMRFPSDPLSGHCDQLTEDAEVFDRMSLDTRRRWLGVQSFCRMSIADAGYDRFAGSIGSGPILAVGNMLVSLRHLHEALCDQPDGTISCPSDDYWTIYQIFVDRAFQLVDRLDAEAEARAWEARAGAG